MAQLLRPGTPTTLATPLRVPVPSTPTTAFGTELSVNMPMVLFPISPYELSPQQSTRPEESLAQIFVPLSLPVRLDTPFRVPVPPTPFTAVGKELSSSVPLPSCPFGPYPQQSVPWEVRIAHMVVASLTRLATPLSVPVPPMPTTAVGTELFSSVPLPSSPSLLSPQQTTPPEVR